MLKQHAGLASVLGLICLIFSTTTEHFFQLTTFASIANQVPDLVLVAIGMTFVLILKGIDLSVGSVLALSSAVLGYFLVVHALPLIFAIAIALLTGLICGAANGIISVKARIPSFIVTLGMLEVARGLTKLVTSSQTIYIGTTIEFISTPHPMLRFSPAFIFAITVVMLGQLILTRTTFGRYCIAIGTNEEAVKLSGINVIPYQVSAFLICGLMCGTAGVIHASKLSSADPNAASGIELSAIAACVIGGTSLMGGRGNIISTFFGVLIIATLQTGLAQMGVSDPLKQLITGVVIITAVVSDSLRQRWTHLN